MIATLISYKLRKLPCYNTRNMTHFIIQKVRRHVLTIRDLFVLAFALNHKSLNNIRKLATATAFSKIP